MVSNSMPNRKKVNCKTKLIKLHYVFSYFYIDTIIEDILILFKEEYNIGVLNIN